MQVSLQTVAAALELTVEQLREFADFSRREQGYRHRCLPKRHAVGTRPLAMPRPALRVLLTRLDYWLKHEVHLPIHDVAHGFVKGRSIATHAAFHVGAVVVVSLDLADWFTTIRAERLETALRLGEGWDLEAARVVALVATDAQTGGLPQGAATSPLFANFVAYSLDQHLAQLAGKFGCVYTRYADDLTFSSKHAMGYSSVERFLTLAEKRICAEGFTVKRKKTKVTRPWQRMGVAGLVVNPTDALTATCGVRVSRDFVRRVRSAIRHQQTGHDVKWTREQIVSAIGFIQMVNPAQAEKLREALAAIQQGETKC